MDPTVVRDPPWLALASALVELAGDDGPNVYPAPPAQVVPDAIVLRPDAPWISREAFEQDVERYVAVGVVSAGDTISGTARLYGLVGLVRDAVDVVPGWAFDEAGSALIDETTGTPLLAAPVRLTYRA